MCSAIIPDELLMASPFVHPPCQHLQCCLYFLRFWIIRANVILLCSVICSLFFFALMFISFDIVFGSSLGWCCYHFLYFSICVFNWCFNDLLIDCWTMLRTQNGSNKYPRNSTEFARSLIQSGLGIIVCRFWMFGVSFLGSRFEFFVRWILFCAYSSKVLTWSAHNCSRTHTMPTYLGVLAYIWP